MANPEHRPTLDGFDQLTVALYRLGLGCCALAIGWVAWSGGPASGNRLPSLAAGAAASLCAANLHLYDKRIRWVLAGSAPLGLAVQGLGIATDAPLLQLAGLGFGFVTCSGLALKEQFCFRIPGLRAVPALLALGLVPAALSLDAPRVALLGPAALLLALLTALKLRQPLGHDIGDRRHYQN